MSFLEIKNLSFKYDNKKIFDKLSLSIDENTFVSISGKNGCGKTTLVKLLSGSLNSNGCISIDGKLLNFDNKEWINKIVTVFSKDNLYLSKTVFEELLISYEKDDNYSINKIKKYLKEFDLYNCMNEPILNLNFYDKQKVTLIKALLNESKLLILDNIFCYFDKYSKLIFMSLLKKYQVKNKFIIISMINDLEDSLYSDRLILIGNKNIIIDDVPDYVLLDESILKKVNLKVPINYELNNKLKLYGLYNGNSLDVDDMVMDLCK